MQGVAGGPLARGGELADQLAPGRVGVGLGGVVGLGGGARWPKPLLIVVGPAAEPQFEGLGGMQRRHAGRGPLHGQRQPLRADVERRHAPLGDFEVAQGAPEPTVGRLAARVARMPDIHRLEVGAIGIGIANSLHNRQLAFLEQPIERPQGGVQADGVVHAEDVLLLQSERGPGLVVQVVGIGDDGVQPVVAARQFEHHQHFVLSGGRGTGRPGQKAGHRGSQRDQRGALNGPL